MMRHHENLVQMACVHVQHMQKSLDQMNLQIHHVISDITGVTGLAIVDAIVAGNSNPKELAKLRDHRIKASIETVTKSLVGDYRPEHIFTLKQSLTAYRHYQKLVAFERFNALLHFLVFLGNEHFAETLPHPR